MAALTYTARIAWAKYILSRPLFLAIGSGASSWDTKPKEVDYEATALTHEIGRKKLTRSFFVNEDDDGEIDIPGGRRYSFSETPTRHLYLSCMFNYGEGVAQPIREVAALCLLIHNSGSLILLEHLETMDMFTPQRKGFYGTILTI